MSDRRDVWYQGEGPVFDRVFAQVKAIDNAQSDVYERFLRCQALYDPNDRSAYRHGSWTLRNPWSETPVSGSNVCATNVDTVLAVIAASEPRARFMTDDGDWSEQQRAKRLEAYAEGLVKRLDIHRKVQMAFKSGTIKGTGLLKIYQDGEDIHVEHVPVDEIVVDEGACREGRPREMFQRKIVARDELKAAYPDKEREIDAATPGGSYWADSVPLERDEVMVVEAWRLPIGDMAGRWALCVEGADLFVEEWEHDFFPFAEVRWSERGSGYYGIGLIERIADVQRRLNKLYWQRDRCIDQFAFPTQWVHRQDSEIAIRGVNRAGLIGTYSVEPPKTIIPPAVSPDIERGIDKGEAQAYEETGTNRMTANASVPAGFESGEAIRQFHDKTTQRFAMQEKQRVRLFLDTVERAIGCAKELGAKAPKIMRKGVRGKKRAIHWPDVDMGDVRVQITEASSLAKTPSGQLEFAAELADRGLITSDEYRALLDHPDVGHILSAYTAAYENTERCIEEILDGETLSPEPYQNLQMIVWRGQMRYLEASDDGCPEETLENLRTWVVQAAAILNPPAPPAQPGMPAQPGLAPPGEMPQPGAPPVMAPASPALAPPPGMQLQ